MSEITEMMLQPSSEVRCVPVAGYRKLFFQKLNSIFQIIALKTEYIRSFFYKPINFIACESSAIFKAEISNPYYIKHTTQYTGSNSHKIIPFISLTRKKFNLLIKVIYDSIKIITSNHFNRGYFYFNCIIIHDTPPLVQTPVYYLYYTVFL